MALLTGCGGNAPPPGLPPAPPSTAVTAALPAGPDEAPVVLTGPDHPAERSAIRPEVIRGTGQFVRQPGPVKAPPEPSANETAEGVTLDFINADIRDVVRHVLGDLLAEDYAIDPAVQGVMTFTTREPVPRAAVLAALEEALRLNGLALVKRTHGYLVLPSAGAARSVALGRTADGAGFGTQMIPVHNVSAAEIQKAIEPLLPANVVLRADSERNLLIVGGSAEDIAHIVEDVAIFDVDYLRGMSFALLPLHNAPAKAVAAELANLMGPRAGRWPE